MSVNSAPAGDAPREHGNGREFLRGRWPPFFGLFDASTGEAVAAGGIFTIRLSFSPSFGIESLNTVVLVHNHLFVFSIIFHPKIFAFVG